VDDDNIVVIGVLLYAERADDLIKASPFVDAGGRLVAQQAKIALTASDELLLDGITVIVSEGDPLAGTTVSEFLPQLVGKQGFPRYPAVIPGGSLSPSRSVTYEEAE